MTYIGRPLPRVEDRPLLVGAGRYVDDLRRPGTVHVRFVRSVHAHARVTRLDTAAARAAPGVIAVVTAADTRGVPSLSINPTFPAMKIPPHPPLAGEVVRAVGEPIAAVVAETRAQADDAAALVDVAYEPLPPVVSVEDAERDEVILHEALGTNRAFTGTWRSGDVAAAFASAAATARVRVEQQRLSAVALEPRAILAAYDANTDELTVWAGTQGPFRLRAELATALGIPESRVRVIAPDVGGGFGVKGDPYREDVLVAWLARRLARPVQWLATRMEDLLTTRHGRGGHAEAEIAVDAGGRILGVRARILNPMGAAMLFNGAVLGLNHARTIPNAYVVPAFEAESLGLYTTTMPTGPYRGAGRPEGVFVMERLMDEAAARLGLDPAEIRRRNFVPPDAFPFRNAAGFAYDSGAYAAALDKALTAADYDGLRRAQAAARARGELMGVGLASYVENAALGWESGVVRVEKTGAITIVTGSSAHGQGHETTWAQIAADVLGVDPAVVAVQHGDTRGAPQGVGTFGSRSTALGGSAVWRAAEEVREKARRIAAAMLEAAPEDVVLEAGAFHVAGVPARGITWATIADAAYRGTRLPDGMPPGLEATSFFRAEAETWSFGSCVVAVTIDRDTGAVRLTRCVWVDDAGVIVNPLLAEGQLHGSYAQGAGQALLEAVVYDEQGQPLTASLMDYAVPRLGDFPAPELDKTVTPSPRNPLGAKGLGEAGCIALPPAIVNAVVDALRPWGCTHLDMPITPEKVWRVLRDGRAAP